MTRKPFRCVHDLVSAIGFRETIDFKCSGDAVSTEHLKISASGVPPPSSDRIQQGPRLGVFLSGWVLD